MIRSRVELKKPRRSRGLGAQRAHHGITWCALPRFHLTTTTIKPPSSRLHAPHLPPLLAMAMLEDWSSKSDQMRYYRSKKDSSKLTVSSKYTILGFISSGTYGRVYKAQSLEAEDRDRLYAIKKFKPDKEGDVITYTGVSQSAIREIAVSRFCVLWVCGERLMGEVVE